MLSMLSKTEALHCFNKQGNRLTIFFIVLRQHWHCLIQHSFHACHLQKWSLQNAQQNCVIQTLHLTDVVVIIVSSRCVLQLESLCRVCLFDGQIGYRTVDDFVNNSKSTCDVPFCSAVTVSVTTFVPLFFILKMKI